MVYGSGSLKVCIYEKLERHRMHVSTCGRIRLALDASGCTT